MVLSLMLFDRESGGMTPKHGTTAIVASFQLANTYWVHHEVTGYSIAGKNFRLTVSAFYPRPKTAGFYGALDNKEPRRIFWLRGSFL